MIPAYNEVRKVYLLMRQAVEAPYLSANKLGILLPELGQLTKLTILHLNINELCNIADEVKQLQGAA